MRSPDQASRRKRVANDRLRSASEQLPSHAAVPFLCECGDPWCFARVDIALVEYDYVRDFGGVVRLPEHTAPAETTARMPSAQVGGLSGRSNPKGG
jgi:hypothetical protein